MYITLIFSKIKCLIFITLSFDFYFTSHQRHYQHYYPLANEVAKGYSNATVLPSVRPSVTSL